MTLTDKINYSTTNDSPSNPGKSSLRGGHGGGRTGDGEMHGCGEEQVDGRPTLVTCFRVGAVVQAGGETKGIGRRDWPVVSCRAEPPLVRCDGSQASAICGRRSLQGDRSGWGPPWGRSRRS